MKHHLPILELAHRGARSAICTKCSQRPPGSEHLSPEQPRTCEGTCAIFLNLPHLMRIAWDERGETTGPYEHAIQELICSTCKLTPIAGEYCVAGATRACPLSRYGSDVVKVIEKIVVNLRKAG